MGTSKRRERGDVGVYQRPDGTWKTYIYQGLDSNGKPQRKYFYASTKDEVIKKRNAAMAHLSEPDEKAPRQPAVPTNVPTKFHDAQSTEQPLIVTVQPAGEAVVEGNTIKRIKLGEWEDHWLETYVYSTVGSSTYDWYSSLIETHIKPSLGQLWVDKFNTDTAQSLLTKKSRDEKKSTSTVRAIRMVLHHSMGQAVTNGYVVKNPVDGTKIARVRWHKPFSILTKEQTRKFIEVTSQKEYPLGAMYVAAVLTGMRQGELFGLALDCIDLSAKVLRVMRVIEHSQSEGEHIREYPKSDHSCRQIVISDAVAEAFQAYREAVPPGEYGLAFTNAKGGMLNKDNLRHRFWARFKKDAGLSKNTSFRDLRHTHATQLLTAGIHPKVVSERLGHASVTFTMDTYQHYIPSLQQGIQDQLNGPV